MFPLHGLFPSRPQVIWLLSTLGNRKPLEFCQALSCAMVLVIASYVLPLFVGVGRWI